MAQLHRLRHFQKERGETEMRKLVWLTIGFCLSCFLFVYKLWNAQLLGWILIPAVLAATCGYFGRNQKQCAEAAWILLGISIGMGWFSFYQKKILLPLQEYDGETRFLSIRAVDYSEPSRYSSMVEGSVKLAGKNYRVLVYLNDLDDDLNPGDRIEGNFRLRVTAPGGLKESSYYQGQKIFLIASLKGEGKVLPLGKAQLRDYPAILRHRMKENIRAAFPEKTAPFALALMLGDTEDLDYVTATNLSVSGIRHLAAVSGLHIGILYAAIVLLLGRNRFFTPILSSGIMLAFAAVVGFTPSVTRACIMTSLMALEFLFYREYDTLSALSFAVLLMLLGNPFLVTSASLQLSVASVLGITLLSQPISKELDKLLPKESRCILLHKLRNFTIGSVSVSMSALIFTIPLTAYYFHTISLISLLTNFLTIWCVSFLFCGIGIVCLLAFLSMAVASWGGQLLSFGISYVLWVASVLSKVPFAAVYSVSPWILGWVILAYGIGIAAWILGRNWKKPASVIIASLIAAIILSRFLPKQDSFRVSVVYVGEGQSIILESKGHVLLVDCGGNYDQTVADSVAEELLGQGIEKVDAVALTHYDRDHTGGLPYLLTRVEAERFYFPDIEDSGFREKLGDVNAELIQETTVFSLGTANVTLYKPGNLKTNNENCMCILFETENCVILITGDRGASGEKHLVKEEMIPDVDILIAGHHGSKNSTTDLLLDTVTPETVIVSAGKNNSYGHPAQEVLERLEIRGCEVLRTDLQGTIRIRR